MILKRDDGVTSDLERRMEVSVPADEYQTDKE
jgi:hypothetical protein